MRISIFFSLLSLCACFSPKTAGVLSNNSEELLAFPTAEGFGAFAKGGRGGEVFHVTNLNNDGEGSLRWAINQEVPRTIVFDVSGIIDITEQLTIVHPYVTIAGQTAPGEGICIRGETLRIEAAEVIIRYLKVRLGDGKHGIGSLQGKDAISVAKGKNIIVDHCSASWSLDEVLSTSTYHPHLTNVTIQWCFITEGLNPDGHGFGSLIRGTGGAKYSYLYNLYAHNHGRNPRPGNYDRNPHTQDSLGLLLDFRNNVIYNWGGKHAGYNADKESVSKLNYVNNYLISGVNSINNGIAYSTGSPYNQAFFDGNYYNHQKPKNQWSLVHFNENWSAETIKKYQQNQPFETGFIRPISALESYRNILEKGGASLPQRDIIDQRIIEDIKNNSGKIINSQEEVGGWPLLKAKNPQLDSDRDGMPDEWEIKNHLNINDASDRNEIASNGYTMLENYLNQLANDSFYSE